MNLIHTIAENLEAYQDGAEDASMLSAGREGGHGLDNLEGIAFEWGITDVVAYGGTGTAGFLAAQQLASAGLADGDNAAVGKDRVILEGGQLIGRQAQAEAGGRGPSGGTGGGRKRRHGYSDLRPE
jgi:hypothetical protein